MLKKILLITVTLVFATVGCATTAPVTFEARKGFNPETKKVVTMAVFFEQGFYDRHGILPCGRRIARAVG